MRHPTLTEIEHPDVALTSDHITLRLTPWTLPAVCYNIIKNTYSVLYHGQCGLHLTVLFGILRQ